jgi:glucose-1-phosphate thymidylyltransferase
MSKTGSNLVGILLAGGTGSRLRPMTRVTNKHMLPVYDKPMIYYGLDVFRRAGITKTIIVTGSESAGDFMELIGDGSEFGMRVAYILQKEADGIAGAIKLCEPFVEDEHIAVILGDNIFGDPDILFRAVGGYIFDGATLFLKSVKDPTRFGVAVMEKGTSHIAAFIEKPSSPDISNLAVTGLYIYDKTIWDKLRKIAKSARGEYEITDVNNLYLSEKRVIASHFDSFWSDAGTYDSLLDSSNFIRDSKNDDSRI